MGAVSFASLNESQHWKKRLRRVQSIERVLTDGEFKYKILLSANHSFDFSGSQVTYAGTIPDVYDALQHIVFCDGEVIY